MPTCKCCGQTIPPKLSKEEYGRRAIPRLEAIDILAAKIDFSSGSWQYTPEGERYKRLMAEQNQDEVDAGL
jgi:hypothetical protein